MSAAVNNRELLEMAAKAMGLKPDTGGLNGGRLGDGFSITGALVLDWHNGKTWNPLHDAGDALRLAVKRGYSVCYYRNAPPELGLPRECAVVANEAGRWVAEVDPHGDEVAATCRAIVRLAAEEGEAVP